MLLGCEYAPLREQFLNLPKKLIRDKIQNILITIGGTDNYNVAGSIITAFSEIEDFLGLHFKVICGIYNTNRELLLKLSEKHRNVEILEPTDNIAPLMCEADLAISAAGTTLYELCACGTPTICFTLADNQLDNARGFEEKGLMYYAGDVRYNTNEMYKNIITNYFYYKKNMSNMPLLMKNITDGSGASRIC